MAAKIQPVIADTGSVEVLLTRQQVNILVTALEAVQAAAALADFATFATAMAAIDLSSLRQIVATKELPAPPLFPVE